MKVIYFNKKIYRLKSVDLDELSLLRGLAVCDVCDLSYKCTGNYTICEALNKNLDPSDLIPTDSVIIEIRLFELIKRFIV